MSKLEELIQELCPDGVNFKPLGNIVRFINGRAYKQSELLDEGKYKVLRVGNFYTNDKWYYSDLELDKDKYCENGDLLYTWAATLGPQIWVGERAIFHYHIWKLSFDENILDKRFLYHFLDKDIDDISKSLTKSTMPHISMSSMNKRLLPLPPLPVQREIVRILDNFTELTAELQEKLTAELTARKKQYEYYRTQLLMFGVHEGTDRAVSRKLGEIAKFVYGYTDKAQEKGSARFIRITDISEDGTLNPQNAKYVELTEESEKYLLKKGDVLLARTGATYGKTLYFDSDEPSVYASFLIKIILDNSVIRNRYYWHFSKSSLYWTQAEKLVSQGGQQQFNANAVSRISVPVPSLEIQDRIVDLLDNFEAIYSDLTSGLPAEIEARQKQYEYYRDKLLNFPEYTKQR